MAMLPAAANELRARRSQLDSTLSEHADLEALRLELAARREALAADRFILDGFIGDGGAIVDQVADLRAEVTRSSRLTDRLVQNVSRRIDRLDRLNSDWQQLQDEWTDRQKRVIDDASMKVEQEIVRKALVTIDQGLAAINDGFKPFVRLQAQALAVQSEHTDLSRQLDRLIQTAREDLLRRNAPAMVSFEFFQQLASPTWERMQAKLSTVPWQAPAFFDTRGWVVLLQVFVMALIGWALGRHRELADLERRWTFLVERPWATGTLISLTALAPLYGSIPPLWGAVLWALAAFSATRLLRLRLEERWQRQAVSAVAVFFVLSQLLRLLGPPQPLLRLYVALVSAAGAAAAFRVARRVEEQPGGRRVQVVALRFTSALLALVLLAELAGFSALAAHVFEAALESVFLVLLAWILALVIRGAIQFGMTRPVVARSGLIRNYRRRISRRADLIVNLVVGALAFLALLYIWGLFDTPLLAAETVLGFGPWIRDLHLTVGLILLLVALIATTRAVSHATQAVLSEEVYPRWLVSTGVGASINRLVHYAVVLVGILTVVSALGFGLQNVAIIGGAIGVGIGFGLQGMVNNFVSGLILLIERPVKVGDVVVIGDVWGKIIQVGLRATVVETFDQAEIVLPNSDLVSRPVTNWTRSSRGARLTVPIGVAYGSDVPLVMRCLREAAEAQEQVLRDPPPVVFFLGFGQSSLNFELKAWIANVNDQLTVRSALNQVIDERFRREGIEIPFPRHDVNLRNPVQVRLEPQPRPDPPRGQMSSEDELPGV